MEGRLERDARFVSVNAKSVRATRSHTLTAISMPRVIPHFRDNSFVRGAALIINLKEMLMGRLMGEFKYFYGFIQREYNYGFTWRATGSLSISVLV